jgi:thiol:disulfide interchange protein DsbA
MNRRDFLAQAAGAAALAAPLSQSQAQGGFVEGRHYVRLGTPQPVLAPAGKIEVVEFFWYGCPHCNAFEPALEAWVKALPADVMFRRMPVAFRSQHEVHQRLYFALEAMGQLQNVHRRVFAAIHVERLTLDKPEAIADFVAKNGVDRAKFMEVFDSFSVQSKARQARQLTEGYKIDGVPALGIHGRFYTSPSLVGGDGAPVAQAHTMALRLTDQLIAQVRTQR